MGPRILLVNPSIHDFSAYDFWLKPYGLLQVAGQLRGKAELHLFDYLDLGHAFYLGFESSSYEWQRKTGGKVYSEELPRAVENLTAAGADLKDMTAYLIVGHPRGGEQNVEESMRFAHGLGLRIMLSEFSPIPGTPDGESCREWVDLDEPLWHSKTVFPLVFLGGAEVNRLKALCHELNHRLNLSPTSPFSALTLGYNRTHERGYS